MKISRRNNLLCRLQLFLDDVPKGNRSRYEVYQIRVFNRILFHISSLAILSLPLIGFETNASERVMVILLLVFLFWGLIFLNKKGYDHIARPVCIIFSSLFNGYISYREGHQLNTQHILLLIPLIGFAITPRNRPLEIGLSIAFPLLILAGILFVDIPQIAPVSRSAEEVRYFANISMLVHFAILTYLGWLLINMNNRVYEKLIARIDADRQIQRELIQQGQELRIAQQLAKVGFWEFTSDGQTRWSKETYDILHIPRGAKVNKALIAEHVHPEDFDFVIQNLVRGTREGGKYLFNFRLHPRHGERWIAVSCIEAVPVPNKLFFHSRGIVHDITTSKQTEQQLQETIAAKDRVLAMVSHDLRNPLASTLQLIDLTTAELKKSNYGGDRKLLLEYAEMMRISQQRTISIINDLLDLCTQKHIIQLSGQATDLFGLVEQVTVPQIYRAAKKGVLLQIKPANNDICINAVADKIARALENLIVNAIKFTPMGGKITVSVEKAEDFALVAVADTGIGIPDHLKSHLFERSNQVQRYGTEGERSTGLGLSIVKQWVEMHNGTVWCEDNKPQGTIFYMSFPLAKDQQQLCLSNNRANTF
ncbi:ATP-binding protein [Rhodoflexus sp.]